MRRVMLYVAAFVGGLSTLAMLGVGLLTIGMKMDRMYTTHCYFKNAVEALKTASQTRVYRVGNEVNWRVEAQAARARYEVDKASDVELWIVVVSDWRNQELKDTVNEVVVASELDSAGVTRVVILLKAGLENAAFDERSEEHMRSIVSTLETQRI